MRFERPPIVELSESLTLQGGEGVVCSIKPYESAIVEAQLEMPFEEDWEVLPGTTVFGGSGDHQIVFAGFATVVQGEIEPR